ncbi:MAG TPA: hypothetical protein VKA43_02415, partial [Gammaproteobacteria bacterium]|nr:hypothetical protein [Gammaproteobacteria bacterium]
MSRAVAVLLGAQFLTALADNAILFTAIAMLFESPRGAWYVPALQAAFLVAFVVLAPWVGAFADSRSKPSVLLGRAAPAARRLGARSARDADLGRRRRPHAVPGARHRARRVACPAVRT